MRLSEAVERRYSVKNVFLRILQNSQEKNLNWSLFLIKLQAFSLPACNFIIKILRYRCFPRNFAKFLRTTFTEHLRTAASEFFCTLFRLRNLRFRKVYSRLPRKVIKCWRRTCNIRGKQKEFNFNNGWNTGLKKRNRWGIWLLFHEMLLAVNYFRETLYLRC